MDLLKEINNSGLDDQWTMTVTSASSGLWTSGIAGSPVSTTPGAFTVLHFDSSGNISQINDSVGNFYVGSSFILTVNDGTTLGQSINIDLSSLNSVVVPTVNSVTGTQDGTSATPAVKSTSLTVTGAIDSDRLTPSGSDSFTKIVSLVDAIGETHSVNINFSKTGTDQWNYVIDLPSSADGDWLATADFSGTLEFDNDTKALTLLNGAAPALFNITINDRHGNQTVAVDLTALTQPSNGTTGGTTGSVTIVADEYETTNESVFASRLVSGAGPTEFKIFPVYDNTGMDAIDGVKVTFTQVGDTNSWAWAVTAPAVSGLTGIVRGGTGTVNFNHAGNILGPTQFKATLDDGTAEGQTINFNIMNLRMGRTNDLVGTTTDGGESGDDTVNAVIAFSGVDGGESVVLTLEGVSRGARTANLGGISFTVNQATSLDVGLTAFVKAHTYVSATTSDDSLQFQVGPDEGMVERLGIRKMDVQSIFRGGVDSYDYQDILLDTQLQAQDLIGALDDAINYVSEENLKVGAFQNLMSRTLELSRQQQTSITGALSNLNDADMAAEATNQSKRSILV